MHKNLNQTRVAANYIVLWKRSGGAAAASHLIATLFCFAVCTSIISYAILFFTILLFPLIALIVSSLLLLLIDNGLFIATILMKQPKGIHENGYR